MKIAILADIHDDATALDAVCNEVRGKVDQIWSLGDVVGYGVYSEKCLRMLRQRIERWVIGNHEEMLQVVINSLQNPAYRLRESSFFEAYQEICDLWQEKRSTACDLLFSLTDAILLEYSHLEIAYETRPEVIQALLIDCVLAAGKNLFDPLALDREWRGDWKWFVKEIQAPNHQPYQVCDEIEGWRLVLAHGSLASAKEYTYPWSGFPWNTEDLIVGRNWTDLMDRVQQLRDPERRLLVLMGHTHIPLYCPIQNGADLIRLDATQLAYDTPLPLGEWATLINPGSVGHPRDLDARAAYAIVDTAAATVIYYRLKIDRTVGLRQMRENYLPVQLQMEYRDALAPDLNDPSKMNILTQRLQNVKV